VTLPIPSMIRGTSSTGDAGASRGYFVRSFEQIQGWKWNSMERNAIRAPLFLRAPQSP